MSTDATWFAIPPPSVHLDARSYFTFYTPIQLVYFVSAVLVTIPNTYALRLSLFPVFAYLLWRTTAHLDMSNGNPLNEGNNLGLLTLVATVIMRLTTWTFQQKHFLRTSKYKDANERTLSQILYDGADLCCNFRGVGWDWSDHQVFINPQPHEVEEKQGAAKRKEFIRENIISYFTCSIFFEIALYILFKYPLEEPDEPTWSFFLLRSVHAFLYPVFTYGNLGGTYNLYALIGVCICGQSIEEWPPFYNKPWLSTSLTEFWGKRWHQAFRYTFSKVGGRPLSFITGRAGLVVGTFFISGVFHDLGYWGMHRGRGICCYTTPYFILNGVGCIVEATYKGITGKRVGGWIGRTWTVSWLVGCALATMSPFCMTDLMRSFSDALATQPFYLTYLLVKKLISTA
ncbi:hypothetical protein CYLTODRAFT_457309 [Cylindrobasidium torrendii FP15055 ss-10]|uniref:Wax synthase domain-containing protein n=1 Tax=Cylindrobasidium torrendii FP15055 ss-10 TaxID=1314674 RepID=A0A0D7B1H0_9AGAR|nr:hypothetical protein CYLTODRAFT_457309 [Cylindrobasidium torrendii FP15055 ss-10]